MRSSEIETLIEEYREREQAKRDNMLRARLARHCSREELLALLGGSESPCNEAGKGQILLTNSSSPFIMESAR